MADNLVACEAAGRVAVVAAAVGQDVRAGDALLIVETFGERVTVEAPVAGRIKRQFFAAEDTLPEAAVVAVIET